MPSPTPNRTLRASQPLLLLLATLVACGDDAGSATRSDADGLPTRDVDGLPDADTTGGDLGGSDAPDGSEPDATPSLGQPGEACATDADCLSNVCVVLAPQEPGRCSQNCASDAQCPDGFTCLRLTEGEEGRQVCVADDLCIDPDGDGYGVGPSCRGPDCVPDVESIYPGAPERCDGIDNDCDAQIDENAVGTNDDCETGFLGACAEGRTVCDAGGLLCQARTTASAERCGGRDLDCDGRIDEDAQDARSWYADGDGDRFGTDSTELLACVAPLGYVDVGGDCDDRVVGINPVATEICDDVDNDCDGEVDEAPAAGRVRYYEDRDGDGDGDPAVFQDVCAPVTGWVQNGDDCDDDDDGRSTRSAERCDGIDNDCDGAVDEAGAIGEAWYYPDADSDLFGAAVGGVFQCDPPTGYVNNAADCDDANTARNPGAPEVCNDVDDDCDPQIDEGVQGTWWRDADGDGFGDPAVSYVGCAAPLGYVAVAGDCNDGAALIHPDAAELCDGWDNNCNGQTDEGACQTQCSGHAWNGRGYMFCGLSANHVSWQDARDRCTSWTGGRMDLVIVNSDAENRFVFFQAGQLWPPNAWDDLWVGLSRGADNQFVWIDGTAPTFTSWKSGEPNNNNERCTEMEDYPRGGDGFPTGPLWNDVSCGNRHEFVCEWAPGR